MKQPANSCEVRKGCVVFSTDRTDGRGDEEEEEEEEKSGAKLKRLRRGKESEKR